MSVNDVLAGTAEVIQGNALDLPMGDNSVDVVITSPPYFGLRSYQDDGQHYEGQIGDEATPNEFVDALVAATKEMMRVVKPEGSIWVNLGDKYAGGGQGGLSSTSIVNDYYKDRAVTPTSRLKSLIGIPWRYAIRCIDDLGLILRAEVIWSKPNGLPESVTDRVRRSHEVWFHFTVQPRYFSAVDEIREEYTAAPFRGQKTHKAGQSGATRNPILTSLTSWDASEYEHNPLGKLPGSVWTIPTQPLIVPEHLGVDHFAAFPMEFPRRIIAGWCPGDGVVLDPFGGTGTTALVAKAMGRHGISVDLSGDYCRLAQWRTTDAGQLARAAGIEWARKPRKDSGPGWDQDMFDLGES